MRLKARIFMWAAIACVPLGIFLLLVEVNGNDSAYNIYGWLIMTAGLYCAALWAVFTPQKGNSGRTIVLTWILFFIAFLATIPIVLWGIAIVAFSSAAG